MAVAGLLLLLALSYSVVAPQSAFAQDGDRKVKNKVAPVYPDLARKANISGAVKLEATIAPNGVVRSIRVLGGHPLLAGAAEDALKKWKYEPSSNETTTVVEFKFNPGM